VPATCCSRPLTPKTVSDALIITIDGPAGTGKSTVAAALAKQLGIVRLDTGAMYRTVALVVLREGIDPTDGDAIVRACAAHELRYDLNGDPPRMLLDGEDVEPFIRSAEIGAIVSEVSVPPVVRDVMVRMQRAAAEACPRLVSEGRDQGSVVFPDAQMRFFLTADADERVQRRVKQLLAAGREVDAESIAAEIAHRDHIDASREAAPLVCPVGAVRIDSTRMPIEDVVAEMLLHVQAAVQGA